MYRSSIYYDDTKTQLLESDKDKLDDVSMSHPACGKRMDIITIILFVFYRYLQSCDSELLTTSWLLCHHVVKGSVKEGYFMDCTK